MVPWLYTWHLNPGCLAPGPTVFTRCLSSLTPRKDIRRWGTFVIGRIIGRPWFKKLRLRPWNFAFVHWLSFYKLCYSSTAKWGQGVRTLCSFFFLEIFLTFNPSRKQRFRISFTNFVFIHISVSTLESLVLVTHPIRKKIKSYTYLKKVIWYTENMRDLAWWHFKWGRPWSFCSLLS